MALSTRIVCVATLVGIFASLTTAGTGGTLGGLNKLPIFSLIQPLLPPILRDQSAEDDSVANGCKVVCLAGAFNGTGALEDDGEIHLTGYIWGIVYLTVGGKHYATPKLNGIYDWIMDDNSNGISFAGPAWGTLVGPDQSTNVVDLRSGEFACKQKGDPEINEDGSSTIRFDGTLQKLQVSVNILQILELLGFPVQTPGLPMQGRVTGSLIQTANGGITLTGQFQSMDYLVPISV